MKLSVVYFIVMGICLGYSIKTGIRINRLEKEVNKWFEKVSKYQDTVLKYQEDTIRIREDQLQKNRVEFDNEGRMVITDGVNSTIVDLAIDKEKEQSK